MKKQGSANLILIGHIEGKRSGGWRAIYFDEFEWGTDNKTRTKRDNKDSEVTESNKREEMVVSHDQPHPFQLVQGSKGTQGRGL